MPSTTLFQRIEGAALLVLAVVAFGVADLSWWWFALLLSCPDLTMVGYLVDEAPTGALVYNIGHTLVWPALLLAWGLPTDRPWVIGIGAIWLAHIGLTVRSATGSRCPRASTTPISVSSAARCGPGDHRHRAPVDVTGKAPTAPTGARWLSRSQSRPVRSRPASTCGRSSTTTRSPCASPSSCWASVARLHRPRLPRHRRLGPVGRRRDLPAGSRPGVGADGRHRRRCSTSSARPG